MFRLLSWALSATFFLALIGLVAGLLILKNFSADLPDISQLKNYNPPVVSRVHASDGRLLAEFAAERRVFVPISMIPRRVIDAFLSAEDKTFYEHPGVDFIGIANAVIINLENAGKGRRPVGASTITQQVAKNFLVGNEVSIARKIREALLAFRIEEVYSKDQILELYLNEIFLGQRAYGVASAALAYFSKTLDELTISEAAYLASLPKAPNNYSIIRNYEEAVKRRNLVIGLMLQNNKISTEQAEQARAEKLEMRPRGEEQVYKGADYFVEEIRRDLVTRYSEKAVLEGGLLVRSTLDPRLQEFATKAMRDGLIAYDRKRGWRGPVAKADRGADLKAVLSKTAQPLGSEMWRMAAVAEVSASKARLLFADDTRADLPAANLKWAKPNVKNASDVLDVGDIILVSENEDKTFSLQQVPKVQGGLVALDPNTGRVLAMVGGFSFRQSVFNRATQAIRQPGSSFKPFVYMAALENGFTPSSLVLDAPISLPQGPGLPEWRPANYSEDYLGPTTLRVGMEKSRNVMTVRLASQIGIDKVAAVAEAFGVMDKMPRNYSTVLGSGETTVQRITAAYGEIVNGGRQLTPTLIDSIQDKSGRIIYRHDARVCPCQKLDWAEGLQPPQLVDNRPTIIDPRTAYQMTHILEGVIQRGTGARAKGLPWSLAGKTGTTNDSRDNWFVGFSPDLAVGLYIGFDQPAPLGEKETGGVNAAPIFRNFMANALEGTAPIPFRVPPGLRLVRVNPATGQLAGAGEGNAIWEAFKPGTEPQPGEVEAPLNPLFEEGSLGLEAEPVLTPAPDSGLGGIY